MGRTASKILCLGLLASALGVAAAPTKHTYECSGTVVVENRNPLSTKVKKIELNSELFTAKHDFYSDSIIKPDAEGHFEIKSSEGQIAIEVVFNLIGQGSVTSRALALPGSPVVSLSATLSSPKGKPRGSSSLHCELQD